VTLLCEEGMTLLEVQSALSILHISKPITTLTPRMETWKTGKHYKNYGWDNHNVETCKIKNKKDPNVEVMEWCIPKLLDTFNCESKGENNRRIRSWDTLPNL